VSTLFLILAVFGLLFTVVTLVRVKRWKNLAYWLMLIGIVTGELTVWRLVVEAVVTLGFVALGALDQPAGQLGLWITLVSCFGQLLVIAQSQRARRVLATAIDRPLPRAGGIAELVRPWRRPTDGFTISRDHSYGPHGERNLLDLYRPDGDGPFPVVLQVHGGSWMSGRKDTQQQPIVRRLAQQGYLVACATYRRGGSARLPDHVEDVKAAIAWLRAEAAGHGGDPSFVAVVGGSAGAHLAALATLSGRDHQPGFESADCSTQACVPIYGTFDLTDRDGIRGPRSLVAFFEHAVMPTTLRSNPELWDRCSPLTLAVPDAPPFLVIHGANDVMLFKEESARFVAELRARGATRVAHAELPGAQHAFDAVASIRSLAVADAVVAFLDDVRAGR
jgi:acetyl esterase/lipase